jgi:hypothetical protein
LVLFENPAILEKGVGEAGTQHIVDRRRSWYNPCASAKAHLVNPRLSACGKKGEVSVSKHLKKQEAELERMVRESAQDVKQKLGEYRNSFRSIAPGTATARPRPPKLEKKRLDVERATSEYVRLQKELDSLRNRNGRVSD